VSLLLIALSILYAVGFIAVLSIGLYDESSRRNPEYSMAFKFAILWPWYLLIVRTYNWFRNR
jgi:hypothetical protein